MRDLANLIHMVANHQRWFPHWPRERYARMWINTNVLEAIICRYST